MGLRRSRRIQIERGPAPNITPSVSVDADTVARQYGPLGYGGPGPIQQPSDFYDIRASQHNHQSAQYHPPAPWFEGLDRPIRQPLGSPSVHQQQEMAALPAVEPAGYQPQSIDPQELIQSLKEMAEAMNPPRMEAVPTADILMAPAADTSMAMEALVAEIVRNEPVHYQGAIPTSEAAREITQAIESVAMMGAAEIAPMPMADDGMAAAEQAMAESQAALAGQHQEVAQSLEAMVQGQMAMIEPPAPEDPNLMQQQMDMMMLNMGFGPGM